MYLRKNDIENAIHRVLHKLLKEEFSEDVLVHTSFVKRNLEDKQTTINVQFIYSMSSNI